MTRGRKIIWPLVLIAAFGLSAATQHWLDDQQRPAFAAEDTLYLRSGEALKRASLGFTGLLADMYWISASIYFGEKFEQQRQFGETFDAGKLTLLRPMLDIIVDLDPHHVTAFRFGGFFLQYDDPAEAVSFIELGIRNNPNEWRLYQDLGFAFWRQEKFRQAAEAYNRGGQLPGAPAWMQPMAATMIAKGGDRETARQIFLRLYEESEDDFVKQVCEEQLRMLQNSP
ncbi:MAG: tetratricopeptide repeat protein [Blastocatellales bacterium]